MPQGRELGRKSIDFVTPDGKHVRGVQLHWAFPEDGVDGEAVECVFLRDGTSLPPAKPGQTIQVEYNRKGRVVSVTAVSGKQINFNTH